MFGVFLSCLLWLVPFGSVWSLLTPSGPVWPHWTLSYPICSCFAPFAPCLLPFYSQFDLAWPHLAAFGPVWPHLTTFGTIRTLWLSLVRFDLLAPFNHFLTPFYPNHSCKTKVLYQMKKGKFAIIFGILRFFYKIHFFFYKNKVYKSIKPQILVKS